MPSLPLPGNALTCAPTYSRAYRHLFEFKAKCLGLIEEVHKTRQWQRVCGLPAMFANLVGGELSPAIGAGDDGPINLPAKDFVGNPRIVDGNGDGNAIVDARIYDFSRYSHYRLGDDGDLPETWP